MIISTRKSFRCYGIISIINTHIQQSFDSEELIRKAIAHIDDKMFVAKLQYTVTTGEQGSDWNAAKLKNGAGFVAEKSQTYTLERPEGSLVKYDLVGKIAEGAKLTRKIGSKNPRRCKAQYLCNVQK